MILYFNNCVISNWIFQILQSNQDLVDSSEALKKILALVSGNNVSKEVEKIVNNTSWLLEFLWFLHFFYVFK